MENETKKAGSELSGGLGAVRQKSFLPLRIFIREKGQGFYVGILEMWDYRTWGDGWTLLGIDYGVEEGFKVRFWTRP